MKPTDKSFPGETRGRDKPGHATALWLGFARHVLCGVVAVVMLLFVSPGEVQAHGVHGSLGVTAPIAATDGMADPQGGSGVSESNCITCCAASGCVAVAIPETIGQFDLGGQTSKFQASAAVAACQMAQYGFRRPPKFDI